MEQRDRTPQMEWILGDIDKILDEMRIISSDIEALTRLVDKPEYPDKLRALDFSLQSALHYVGCAQGFLGDLITEANRPKREVN